MDYPTKLQELLLACAEQNASDLHLSVGRHPSLRIDGELIPLTRESVLTPQDAAGLVNELLKTQERRALFAKEYELDFSYSLEDKARFRVNVFQERSFAAAALRLVPAKIRTIEELDLPPILHDFARYSQGFFLVTGPAGHGKSTTLAAIVDEINHTRNEHIVTIEDPIEYFFVPDRSIIDQREVGSDTMSFQRALKSIFRQDPDVIMIGEMRDPETMAAAVTAAETGHLVLASLHTNSAAQTIDRIIDAFPAAQQNQIRSQLASSLVGIISERLVPRIRGGRVPACEIMIANAAVRNLIRENKAYQIDLVIETGSQEGMVSLNRALTELVKKRDISLEHAEFYSLNPEELRMLLGG